MPRRSSSRRQTGFQIRDRWTEKKREVGKRWMARAWDRVLQTYKSRCFDDKGAAEAWAIEKSAKFTLGQDSARAAGVGRLGEQYLDHLRGRNRAKRHLEQIQQALTEMQVAGVVDLTAEDVCLKVERWIVGMTNHRTGAPASPSQKNRFLGYAKSLSLWARRRHLIPLNRLEAVDGFPEPKQMKEVYSADELRRLLSPDREEEEMFLYIALLVYLGCRPSEGKNLTWADIDFEGETVTFRAEVEGNKLKRAYSVPLPPELAEILAPRRKVGAATVIAERYAKAPSHHGLHKAVLRYLRDCDVEPRKRPRHAFRNTCASLLTAMNVPVPEIMRLLNHEDMQTSADYASCAILFRKTVKGWPPGGREFWLRRSPPTKEHASTPSQAQ